MSLIDEAEKLAGSAVKTATTGGIAAFLPEILAVAGVVFALLLSTIFVDHFLLIPRLKIERDQAKVALASANAETESANKTISDLRLEIGNQNAAVDTCKAEGKANADAAVAAAIAALKTPHPSLPVPPAGKTAAEVNRYWQELQELDR